MDNSIKKGKAFVDGLISGNDLCHSIWDTLKLKRYPPANLKPKVLTYAEAPSTYTYKGVVYTKHRQISKGLVEYINKSKLLMIKLSYGSTEPYFNKLVVIEGVTRWSPPVRKF